MNSKTLLIIYIIIFFLSIFILHLNKKDDLCKIDNNLQTKNKKSNKKWALLLTTAVDLSDCDERKKIYAKQIDKWLKETDLDIFVIESTNTGFSYIPPNERLKIIVKDIPKNEPSSQSKHQSSSQSEYQSLLEILNEIPEEYDYIFKVTGRYFLKDLHLILKDIPDADIYLQKNCNDITNSQNSEYFGIKRNILQKLLRRFKTNKNMENNLYDFIKNNNLKFYRLEPFFNDVKRGGDKLLINPL
jgi:ABC-type antimicrobial peptide transport system permease subunit